MSKRSGRGIGYLERIYPPFLLNRYEKVSRDFKIDLKRKQYDYRQRKILERICLEYDVPKHVFMSSLYILERLDNVKCLHRTIRLEQIFACIILFCSTEVNRQYNISKTRLWREQDLDWKTYSVVLSRLLEYYRKNSKLPYNGIGGEYSYDFVR